ncbi:MAG TPA: hypothetical protein VFG81_00115 [Anaerolineales bacterium]|jgi:hypothetical protein|nr:hypothetical protein [Anaerolineales bacterium]
MLKQSFAFILMTVLLAGCAPKGAAPPAKVKALANPTSTGFTEKPTTTPSSILEVVPHNPPPTCPVTVPQNPLFVPPAPYDSLGFEGSFWYGSNSLWTAIPRDGVWWGLPAHASGYSQKVFWWREGYDWAEEPEPDLIVTGERLDAPAPPVVVSKGTNAYAGDIGSAMLVGVDFPTLGCWKLTGNYRDAELSFVVWVAP